VILTTARDEAELRAAALAAGARMLLKPITASALRDSWLAALDRAAQAAPAALPPAGAADPAPSWPGARVLLAEDNRVNQDVAVELLGMVGITPDVAVDGVQAVRMARAASYDLILMDIQMPGIDGLQATRELRSGPGALAVPIVAMTADAFAEDRKACLAAGMNDHLAKPIALSALHAMLKRWLPAR
jgi:CheY-like chemotaxis protein